MLLKIKLYIMKAKHSLNYIGSCETLSAYQSVNIVSHGSLSENYFIVGFRFSEIEVSSVDETAVINVQLVE